MFTLQTARHCFVSNIATSRQTSRIQSLYQQVCLASSGSDIAPPDVADLAKRANIKVTDEEIKEWGPKIEKIVDWFGQLQDVDLEGVSPSLRAEIEAEELRPDTPVVYANKEELLNQVPDKEGLFVKVPKTKTAAD